MLLLTSTSDLLKVTTDAAVTVDVHASWTDLSSNAVTPGRTNTNITTATTTNVVGSPGASTQRNVRGMMVRNIHASTSVGITVSHYDGTNTVEIWKGTLLAQESLEWDGERWIRLSASGIAMYAESSVVRPFLADLFRAKSPYFIGCSVSTVSVASFSSGISSTTNKAICAMMPVWSGTYATGITFPQTTQIAVASMDFNLGLYLAVQDGSGNWAPTTLLSTLAQGTLNIPTNASNSMAYVLPFLGTVWVPPGQYFVAGCYRLNGATTGGYETAVVRRPVNSGTVNGRFDLQSTANVTYQSTDLSTLIPGALVWNDTSSGSAANINFALHCSS